MTATITAMIPSTVIHGGEFPTTTIRMGAPQDSNIVTPPIWR